jgi:hypothetical protein
MTLRGAISEKRGVSTLAHRPRSRELEGHQSLSEARDVFCVDPSSARKAEADLCLLEGPAALPSDSDRLMA